MVQNHGAGRRNVGINNKKMVQLDLDEDEEELDEEPKIEEDTEEELVEKS